MQNAQLLNMVMIHNVEGEVLVLDKVKKEGWEGLTFPGGKVEPGESVFASARREVLEETGLHLGALHCCGFVSWLPKTAQGVRLFGILFSCHEFSGTLRASREGSLQWVDYATFRQMEPKSECMNEMLAIYEGNAVEVSFQTDAQGVQRASFYGKEFGDGMGGLGDGSFSEGTFPFTGK